MPPPRQNYVLSSFGYLLLCIWYRCHYSCVHKYKSSQSLLLLKTWLLNKGECTPVFFCSFNSEISICLLSVFHPKNKLFGKGILYCVVLSVSAYICILFNLHLSSIFFFLLLFLQILIFPFLCENQNWTAFYIKGGAQEICLFFFSIFLHRFHAKI